MTILKGPLSSQEETTVVSGGTAADLFAGAVPFTGYEVINPHATEGLYIREGGDAAVADNSVNVLIAAKSAYTTPVGYRPVGRLSYNATTSGHAVIARMW